MALKPRSKTLATNTVKLWTTEESPFNTSSIVGWQDDQESFTLLTPVNEQKSLKTPEPPSRLVLKTLPSQPSKPSRTDLGTLPSARNFTSRLEQLQQISKTTNTLGDSPLHLKRNIESRVKTEATPQAQVFYEHPVQVPSYPIRKVVARSRSISSSKLPQRASQAIIADPQLLTTWKPIRGKVMDLDPKIIRPESTSNHSSPRPIKKDLRKIRQQRESISYNTEHHDTNNTSAKAKEEEIPQDSFPRIAHNRVPGHCLRTFHSANLSFSRKTFMGISRIVTKSGPNLAKSMPPEGMHYNTYVETIIPQANPEEKAPVQLVQTSQSDSKITIAKLMMRRDTLQDSKCKRNSSPLSVKRIPCGEEIGSRTERPKGSTGIIKMPIFGLDKSERNIFEQASFIRLKDKVKRDRNRCKSMAKPVRPRTNWANYQADDLVVQASGGIETITLTTLH